MKLNSLPIETYIFILIFSGAVFVRLWNLGGFGLFTDELYHAIGAQAILKVGRPVFPNGDEYTRALGFTYLTALSFKLLGVNEFSARLPSVFLNLIFILASFEIVRRLFNIRAALIYLAVMSFSPFMLKMARQCRMYAGFQLFFVLAAFSFYRGFEYDHDRSKEARWAIEKKYGIRFGFLFLSLALLVIAYHLQRLTVNFGIVVLTYALIMSVLLWWQQGAQIALTSKYVLLLTLSGVVILLFALVRGDLTARFIHLARSVPAWYRYRHPTWHYYRYFLEGDYPSLFFLYPISAAFIVKKKDKLGIFIVTTFVCLFVAHSFLFKWKLERYIFYIFPFFVIPVSVFLEWVFSKAYREMVREFSAVSFLKKVYFSLSLLFAGYLFFYPWVNNSKVLLDNPPWANWKQFYVRTGQYLDKGIPIISTSQNEILYYFGRKPTYYLRSTYFDSPGDAEYFAGSSPLVNLRQLKDVFMANGSLYLISENNLLNSPAYITNGMHDFILKRFKEIHLDYKTSIRIFKKRKGDSGNRYLSVAK